MGFVNNLLRKFSRRFIYERRAARRRAISLPARVRIRSGRRTSEYVRATVRDVSASGVGVEMGVARIDGLHVYDSSDMVTPTRLDIEIETAGGAIRFVGETVRYDQTGPTCYHLGVRILEMSEEARGRYADLLQGSGERSAADAKKPSE